MGHSAVLVATGDPHLRPASLAQEESGFSLVQGQVAAEEESISLIHVSSYCLGTVREDSNNQSQGRFTFWEYSEIHGLASGRSQIPVRD